MNWRQDADPSIPDWFWTAIEAEAHSGSVRVEECDVAYRFWGDRRKPTLLLLHGMFAHSHWWDFIAPALLDNYFVVAMDFTGMGDSDYRYDYSMATFAAEVLAVIKALDRTDVHIAAHSFGGWVAILAADGSPNLIRALVLLDFLVRTPAEDTDYRPLSMSKSLYPDAASARQRFRLQPRQPCASTFIVEYIARHSIQKVDAGWTWKFDEDIRHSLRQNPHPEDPGVVFQRLQCPVGVIHGADSIYFSDTKGLDYMRSLRPLDLPVVAIPDAQHHLFLDQPQRFVTELDAMLRRLTNGV